MMGLFDSIISASPIGGIFNAIGGAGGDIQRTNPEDVLGANAFQRSQRTFDLAARNAGRLGRAIFESTPGAGFTLASLKQALLEAKQGVPLDPALEAAAVSGIRQQAAEQIRARVAGSGGLTRAAAAQVSLPQQAVGSALMAMESLRIQREQLRFARQQQVLGALGQLTKAGFRGAPIEQSLAAITSLQQARMSAAAAIYSANLQAQAQAEANQMQLIGSIFQAAGAAGAAALLA